MNAAPAPVSMAVSALTSLMVTNVPALLDLLAKTVMSTRMTVAKETHVRMVTALMTSTPSSATAKPDGLEICVTGLSMNAKASPVKMEGAVKSYPMVIDVDVQWAQRVKTVSTT